MRRFDLRKALRGSVNFLRTSVVTSMILTMLPIIIGIFIFILVPEIIHTPAFRWHEGVLVLILSILIEFPYARYALRPLAKRVMPLAEGEAQTA